MTRPPPTMNRNVLIVSSVLLFHGVALWALQSGLVRHTVEMIMPAELLSQFIEPPQPKVAPPPPPQPAKPVSVKPQPTAKPTLSTLPPPPQLRAIADTAPAPNAPTGVTTPQPPAPPIAAPVAVAPAPAPAPAPAAPPAPAKVELPSSDADYLHNPLPAIPAISKRLGEQGTVLVNVHIGPDGKVIASTLKQSCGFDRLDQLALSTAKKWLYVPGKRGGVPEAMWVIVPMKFEYTN